MIRIANSLLMGWLHRTFVKMSSSWKVKIDSLDYTWLSIIKRLFFFCFFCLFCFLIITLNSGSNTALSEDLHLKNTHYQETCPLRFKRLYFNFTAWWLLSNVLCSHHFSGLLANSESFLLSPSWKAQANTHDTLPVLSVGLLSFVMLWG